MEYAGFWKRFAAFVIDLVVVYIAIAILSWLIVGGWTVSSLSTGGLALLWPDEDEDAGTVWVVLGWVLTVTMPWVYWALMESARPQASLGKMALGIAVTDLEGGRISFGRASARFFAKAVSALTLLVGFAMACTTARKQAFHDRIAHTLVIVKKPSPVVT
jgi:uncharacterized RDD family membrane protein YckC